MNNIKLTTDKLCLESVYKLVCSPEFGAVSIFVGTTRNNFEGKTVTKLEYEAYEQMAIKSLESICNNIRQKFDVGNIAIFHRLGDVPIQEASVIIAISSTHRMSGLNAVPYAIDALKADVPIWKKEVYDNGHQSEWKENSECAEVISIADSPGCVQMYEEIVEADLPNEIPSHLIQVKANLQEINRRISSFIYRKRQQINMSNIQDFCLKNFDGSENSTCARVSAVLKRRKDSKSHLKIHRVENTTGPQTHNNHYLSETPEQIPSFSSSCPSGAEERIANAETYLNIKPCSRNVFSRLKAIEDKILYLESISLEYFNLEGHESKSNEANTNCSKKTYTALELDTKMQELEAKLQKKAQCKMG